jgi:hypothetical protein
MMIRNILDRGLFFKEADLAKGPKLMVGEYEVGGTCDPSGPTHPLVILLIRPTSFNH